MVTPRKPKVSKKKIDGFNDDGNKQIEVTVKFWLPEHSYDFEIMIAANKYYGAIWDIYHECRNVWKYEAKPSEEKIEFAEKIADMCNETGFFEVNE